MKPLPPNIIPPVSACNRQVEVDGVVSGATVTLRRGSPSGEIVAQATVPWSHARLELSPQVTLVGGDRLFADQSVGASASGASAEPLVVLAAPAQPPSMIVDHPVYGCASTIRIDGAVPGARVQVGTYQGGSFVVRGEGSAPAGVARQVPIEPPLVAGEVLVARQSSCDGPWFETPLPPAAPPPTVGSAMPAPTIEPTNACQRHVTVWGVVTGATVTVAVNGSTYTQPFDTDGIYFLLDDPLSEGDTIDAVQTMDIECDLGPGVAPTVVTGPPSPPATPSIVGPVCASSGRIHLAKTVPGATVEVWIDGDLLGATEASGPALTIELAPGDLPLSAGAAVRVRQGFAACDVWSAFVERPVEAGSTAVVSKLAPFAPLVACAGSVGVDYFVSKNPPPPPTQPFDELRVMSTMLGGPIGSVAGSIWLPPVQIPVSPPLIEGDVVWIEAHLCGEVSIGAPETVQGHDPLPTPVLVRVVAGSGWNGGYVDLSGYVPGAVVDVFVDGVWAYSGIPSLDAFLFPNASGNVRIGLPAGLGIGQEVWARQRLCGEISGPSSTVGAEPAPMRAGMTASATYGEAPLTVHFHDISVGVVDRREWDLGDRAAAARDAGARHTYTRPGTYRATLDVHGPDGTSRASVIITVV